MTEPKVLLVEDDPSITHVISAAIEADGLAVDCCETVGERDALLAASEYQLLITDVILGDSDGITALESVKKKWPLMPVIVVSAQNTLDTAVRASEAGAYEYFPKPFDLNELIHAVHTGLGAASDNLIDAANPNDEISESLPLVGRSPAMQNVYRMITKLLKNDLSVLILGESGTGKELVAEAVHNLGHRKSGPFVAINMAAIPAELIEAELFGHEKGAFTGAVNRSIGRFEQAKGGTLFLDEIGDMPMLAQTRLLRALQSSEIRRVGGTEKIEFDARIIAATHQDIELLIKEGKFREDLYYRLNVVPISLPSLRARKQDIGALVGHFLKIAVDEGLPAKQIDAEGLRLLSEQPWRGNVRELKNTVFRLVATSRESLINHHLIAELLSKSSSLSRSVQPDVLDQDVIKSFVCDLCADRAHAGTLHEKTLEAFEIPLLEEVLRMADFNQVKAAALLGINRNTLRSKLSHYKIEIENLR